MQLQVLNSPFTHEQVEDLNRILPTLSDAQKVWLSGFLAASQFAPILGTAITKQTEQSYRNSENTNAKKVTILYGSQTGNAMRLAKKAGMIMEKEGFEVNVSSMSDFKQNHLKKLQNLLIIVSTHGEGDPPDNALNFYEFLQSSRSPKLENIRYSVLSLGDSSYEHFCKTGKEFDALLEQLRGTRIYPRCDCDLDYDESAADWLDGVLNSLKESGEESYSARALIQTVEAVHSRTNPFKAIVLENINLNGRGSNKETRHVELSLEGSGITFEPGDSIGIYPENDPNLVDMLLKEMKWNPDEKVIVNKQGDIRSLKDSLHNYYEITNLTKPLIEKAAKFSLNRDLHDFVKKENEDKLKAYMSGRDLLDLFQDFSPWQGAAQEIVSCLRKLPVRFYSIASSYLANPDEVHLTIGAVRYETHGRKRNGVCSIFAAERLMVGDVVPIYIQPNENFKLPAHLNTSIIMIGPGTGIAPFRSFLQEREELDAKGKSWLFFGDQHFVTDFLYQTEWQNWLKTGVLTKMAVAFSRDNKQKVYVQQRILEHSKELFKWLEEGAIVYICGDEKHMARDVHKTLKEVIAKEGRMSHEKAEHYLAEMMQQKRYQRDVY